jgi:genome maintenance exonuclease 1
MFEHAPIDLGYNDLVTEQKDGKRHYRSGSNLYPSITTVLSILSKEGIANWRAKVGEEEADKISYRASTRGTAVHEIIEKYLNNESEYRNGYMPNIIANFLSVKEVLDERIGKIYGQELPLYSDHLRVAGRVDCVAQFDGKDSIIDFKTSRKPKLRKYITNYFQQESAYAVMWEERTRMPITQLVTIVAVDDSKPQVFIEHRDNWVPELLQTIKLFENQ